MMRQPALPASLSPRAFTLAEVMVASVVLVFAIVSAVTVTQRGLQAIDAARGLTGATQLMQSEMERLRLMSWSQIQALQDTGGTTVALDGADSRFACTREIRDLKTNMKEITLVTTWKGYDGRPHTARLITRYGKTGLNDYFYTAR